MEQDVYIDILFLINFSMDYLCIYICSKVLHRKMKLSGMVIASAIGGIYSVLSLFLPFSNWYALAIDVAVCLIMCAVVYSEKGRGIGSFFLSSFLFIGISMMTGGCMTAIFNLLNKLDLPLDQIEADGISTYMFAILAIIAGIISLKSGEFISRRSSVMECKLTITFCKKKFEFFGFSDSGNLVRDPISGKAVIFIDRKVLEKEMPISFMDDFIKGKIDPYSPCRNIRLISYKTASGSTIAAAVMPDSINAEFIDKKGKNVSISLDALISPCEIGSGAGGYNAIIPAEIIKQ